MSFCWSLGLKLSPFSHDKLSFSYYRKHVDFVRRYAFYFVVFKLTIIYSLLVIIVYLALVSLRIPIVGYATPARPVSRGRRRDRSSNAARSGSNSTRMSRQLPSRCRSPIILRPPSPSNVLDGYLHPGGSRESSVSFPRGSSDRPAPGWRSSQSPNLNRAWCPFNRPFRLNFSREILMRNYLGLPYWAWGLLTVT